MPKKVDFRLMCASNMPLEELSNGQFLRKDFFYRINTFIVEIPPLREQKEMIPELAAYFLRENMSQAKFSKEAFELLLCYHFPGNIRELKSAVEYALSVAGEGAFAIPLLYLGTLFLSRSAITEGRLKGERYSVALNSVNENEKEIVTICKVSGVNPRVLGAAIYSERALNYLPIFENILSFLFGNSLGFSQVNTNALAWAFKILWFPTEDDSVRYISGRESDRLRAYFGRCKGLKLWQLKFKLWGDREFNIACAALVLKLIMIRYETSKNGFNVSDNPAIAGTLYHIKFPRRITGEPDDWGRLSERMFFDKSFMPVTTAKIDTSKIFMRP